MQSVSGAIVELGAERGGPILHTGEQGYLLSFLVETSDGRRFGGRGCVTASQRDCFQRLKLTRAVVTVEIVSNFSMKLHPTLDGCHFPVFISTTREQSLPELVRSA